MRQVNIKRRISQGILGGLMGVLLLGAAAPLADAKPRKRDRDREDRYEKRWDRHDDARDRYEERWEKRGKGKWKKWNRHWQRDKRWGKRHWKGHKGYFKDGYRLRHVVPKRRHWYDKSHKIRFQSEPYYFHGGLRVYLGGFALYIDVGNYAPEGYVFIHPYTGEVFRSVRQFKRWCRWNPGHQPVLQLAPEWSCYDW